MAASVCSPRYAGGRADGLDFGHYRKRRVEVRPLHDDASLEHNKAMRNSEYAAPEACLMVAATDFDSWIGFSSTCDDEGIAKRSMSEEKLSPFSFRAEPSAFLWYFRESV